MKVYAVVISAPLGRESWCWNTFDNPQDASRDAFIVSEMLHKLGARYHIQLETWSF